MGFKGSMDTATSATIKKKINQFLRNARRRHSAHTQEVSQQQSEETHMSVASQEEIGKSLSQLTGREDPQQIECVNRCVFEGTLAGHLSDNPQCCDDYIQLHLQDRSRLYQGKMQLAVFDLSILLLFCANPACDAVNTLGEQSLRALCTHIEGPCLDFYQNKGTSLLQWAENLDPNSIYTKLRNRRCYLMKSTRNTEEHRMGLYRNEFENLLTNQCQTCSIRGPLLGIEDHNLKWIGNCFITNTPLYMCPACENGEERHMEMVSHLEAMLEGFSKAKPRDTSAMVLVENEHSITHVKRIMFVPSHLQDNRETIENNIPFTATVLVPNRPESLDEMEEEFFDMAIGDRDSLKEVTEFASVRPMVGPPTEEISVFWRKKQADIKAERLSIFKSLSGTSKGEIEKRQPNIASISKRNPSYNLTKELCLVDTCSWSEGAQKKRCRESQARSSVNGVVKTWVSLTLVNFEAQPPLQMAPFVLTSAYAKLRAMMKHIIEPGYTNYDLDLRFHATEWRINLFGFLYSKQYEEINAMVARRGENQASREILLEIDHHRELRPTVSLDYAQLAEDYDIEEERAKKVVTLARKYQTDGDLQPLSLLDLNSPGAEIKLHSDEMRLRTRAAELGQSYGEDVNTYNAIEEICNILMSEGFDRLAVAYGNLDWLKGRLSRQNENCCDNVIKYHALLQRTGGKKKWTFERSTGESCVVPYIPMLLEANDQKMEADVYFQGEQIETDDFGQDEGLTGFPPSSFGKWKEVSVLQFLNGCIPGSKVPQIKGPSNQTIVQIITERNVNLTWRATPDGDQGEDGVGREDVDQGEDVFFSKQGQPYMRTTGDIRVLYEMRPAAMEAMTLAQFATQYRVLMPSRETHRRSAYEKTVAEIDPATKVGPDSSELIAGTSDRAAPVSMRLRNEKIMVKRSRGENAVPYFLYSGAVNRYANRLLFSPWRELESLDVEREDIETARERQTRLELFPMGVFENCQEDSDVDDKGDLE